MKKLSKKDREKMSLSENLRENEKIWAEELSSLMEEDLNIEQKEIDAIADEIRKNADDAWTNEGFGINTSEKPQDDFSEFEDFLKTDFMADFENVDTVRDFIPTPQSDDLQIDQQAIGQEEKALPQDDLLSDFAQDKQTSKTEDAPNQAHQLLLAEVEQIEKIEKPKAVKKVKNPTEKIKAFLKKNKSVPCGFVYYVRFPNQEERQQFLMPKNVCFVKLFVWDGVSKHAFSVEDLRVFEVVQKNGENFVQNGDFEWKIAKYITTDRFLKKFEFNCKNRENRQDLKNTLEKLKEWNKILLQRVVMKFDGLVEYQSALNVCQSQNMKTYNQFKKDFDECIIAQESFKLLFEKL